MNEPIQLFKSVLWGTDVAIGRCLILKQGIQGRLKHSHEHCRVCLATARLIGCIRSSSASFEAIDRLPPSRLLLAPEKEETVWAGEAAAVPAVPAVPLPPLRGVVCDALVAAGDDVSPYGRTSPAMPAVPAVLSFAISELLLRVSSRCA